MGSDWNKLLDRLLAEKLTVAEYRLALAFARLLLGWRRFEAPLGQRLLRETSRLDGRTFERALAGLVERGLVDVATAAPRRRSTYTLNLVPKVPAPQRADQAAVLPAPARAQGDGSSARSHDGQLPALQRGRIGSGKGKTPAFSAGSTEPNQFRRDAFDAYLATGGTLTLERERATLARAVNSAAKAGTDQSLILAACRDLGRTGDLPGLLKQRIAELAERGGACEYEGLDRSRMTPAQLERCGCMQCTEWAKALEQADRSERRAHARSRRRHCSARVIEGGMSQ
jgi:hypothetical protein